MTSQNYEKKKTYRYLVDMTLLSKLKNGLQWDDMCDNLLLAMEHRVKQHDAITPRTKRANRSFKFNSFEIPVALHNQAVEQWTWFWKTRGAGGVLNTSMEDLILDMTAKGYVSFNDYCDRELRRK